MSPWPIWSAWAAAQHGFDQRRVNIGRAERIGSVALGAGLLLSGLRGGLLRQLAFGLAGAALVRRGLTGHCDAYQALGIDATEPWRSRIGVPARQGARVEERIAIDCYPAEIYRYWRNLANVPRFMRHLQAIERIDDAHWRWMAHGILGAPVEWEAEIVGDKENELIAWRSVPGSQIDTAGAVHFERSPDGHGTVVRVEMTYNPVGGKLGAALASLLEEDAQAKIQQDLRNLKAQMERGAANSPQLAGGLGGPAR